MRLSGCVLGILAAAMFLVGGCDSTGSGNKDVSATDQASDSVTGDSAGDTSAIDLADRPDGSAGDLEQSDSAAGDMAGDSVDDAGLVDVLEDGSADNIDHDVQEQCPPNVWELEGLPCQSEGLECGGENCVSMCNFCNIMVCMGGNTWVRLEAFPMECYADDLDFCIYIDGLYNGCISEMSTCEDVTQVYSHIVSVSGSACTADSDCKVVAGYCGVGLGGCYEVVNNSVSEDQLQGLSQVYSALGCTSAVCDCAEPPEVVKCKNNVCMAE